MTKNVLLHISKILKNTSGDDLFDVACYLITAIKQNISSYDEADYTLRELLFSYYLDCNQYSDAAQILSGVNLDSNSRPFSEKEKADIYVRCAGI